MKKALVEAGLYHYLAALSVCLWLASLFMNGFTFYDERQAYSGFKILLIGWTGIFDLRFAWFANPLYFVGLILLKENSKSSTVILSLSLVIALDMFRFDRVYFNEAGHGADIYGLASGAYIWLASIFIASAASLTKTLNSDHKNESAVAKGGLVLACTMAGLLAFVIWSVRNEDLSTAGAQDKSRLSQAIFKKGMVCPFNVWSMTSPKLPNGPIEILSNNLLSNDSGWKEKLLHGNFPSFQHQGIYYDKDAVKGLVRLDPVTSHPVGYLELSSLKMKDGQKEFRAVLRDREQTVLYDQSWSTSFMYRESCPAGLSHESAWAKLMSHIPQESIWKLPLIDDDLAVEAIGPYQASEPDETLKKGYGKRVIYGCQHDVFSSKNAPKELRDRFDLVRNSSATLIGGKMYIPLEPVRYWNIACSNSSVHYFAFDQKDEGLYLYSRNKANPQDVRILKVKFKTISPYKVIDEYYLLTVEGDEVPTQLTMVEGASGISNTFYLVPRK
ncbi:MAG: hypothetical protein ACOY3E_03310 [Pseudomonadota bacterium]